MIKKLRNKLIIIVTCVIVFVVGLIVGGINVATTIKMNERAQNVIDVLKENGGNIPKMLDGFRNDREGISPETPFKTRYFTVTLLSNGAVCDWNLTEIATVSLEKAISYATQAFENKKSSGYKDNFKFDTLKIQDKTMYIFLDVSSELSNQRTIFYTSLIVGASAIVIIVVLITIFSGMAVKPVAESYEKQKQFITDANHEIKTPLAVIGATNEVLEMQMGENEWTKTIGNQVEKLSELTNQLVFLSRMDEENAKVEMKEFNLSNVVNEIAFPYENIFNSHNKQFSMQVENDIKYVGNDALIGRVVSILLDNASKYTNENGTILLSLSKSGKNIKLTLYNTVEQIEKGNLDCLFERFYRRDKSRNSATGGHGIGLSIAKAVANLHKGKITAHSSDGKSIEFVVTL